ncbi:MAG: aldehyde ferredoxin oxidoreductase C-terminal domain-containing protein [Euryarchaeota archaeon]|nr:aldehyde ferredoxin oxidoreductase C-terminal domain-containing protein [Euryarchaeota archaeon]
METDPKKIKKEHKVLATFSYDIEPVEKGYTNRTLYINLDDNTIKSKSVTEKMKNTFIGGRGFDLWLLWNGVTEDTKWDSHENELCISCGPLGGTTVFPGSGKSIVTTLSPLTGIPIDSNVGGHFGPFLKFSGWDALEIQGKAENDVIVFIDGDNGETRIEEAPLEGIDSYTIANQLTEIYAENKKDKKNIAIVSAGRGAENARFGCLNFSFYDSKREKMRLKQAGRGGTGTVFRNKKIKAIVCKYRGKRENNPADKEKVAKVGTKMNKEILTYDSEQNRMRTVGTSHLVEIMNDHDILPVHNFRYGSHPEAEKISSPIFKEIFSQNMPDGCWLGCGMACVKGVDGFELKTGPEKGKKVTVDGPEYETIAGCGSSLGIFDPHTIIEINYYCDTYGLDTISFGTTMAFLMECYEMELIDKEITDGIELNFGNSDAVLEILHQIVKGKGFGLIVGRGIKRLKKLFTEKYGVDPEILNDIGLEGKGLEQSEYVTKESLAQQGGYYMALKGPQHDEAWLIFMDMVNNQIPSFEDKAEALHYFPMWRTWFSLCGLCKLPWNDVEPPYNAETDEPAKVPEHVKAYVEYFAGVTGKEVTNDNLIKMSERVYNFQRIFNLRMGQGTREYDYIPYRAMGPVTNEEYESRQDRYDTQLGEIGIEPKGKGTTEKRKILREYREEQYEKLKDAVYKRRGWTNNGVPTLKTVKKLKIDFPDLVELVKKHQ